MERSYKTLDIESSSLTVPVHADVHAFENRRLMRQVPTQSFSGGLRSDTKEFSAADPRLSSGKLLLIDIAAFLYTTSLHKFVAPADPNSRYGGLVQVGGIIGSLLCVLLATRSMRKRYAPSLALVCFVCVGLFALASSWRGSLPGSSYTRGVLCLSVLANVYLVSQSGLDRRYFRAVYWSYVGLLILGLLIGSFLPRIYPLFSVDEYSGRATFSVFYTFFGVMGEDAALMILIAPLAFDKPLWISGIFLAIMDVMAGEKAPTILLLLLLSVRFLYGPKRWRSWRTVALVVAMTAVACYVAYLPLASPSALKGLSGPTQQIYGDQISENATSFDGRLDLWKRAVELLPTVPLLGYGFEGDRDLMLEVAKWSGSAHNSYLEVALSSGLIGFLFLIVGMFSVSLACLRAAGPLRLHLLLLLTFIGVQGIVGILFYNPSFVGLMLLTWCSYRALEPEQSS